MYIYKSITKQILDLFKAQNVDDIYVYRVLRCFHRAVIVRVHRRNEYKQCVARRLERRVSFVCDYTSSTPELSISSLCS